MSDDQRKMFNVIKTQVIGGVVTAILLAIGILVLEKVTDGWLIKAMNGATTDDMRTAEARLSANESGLKSATNELTKRIKECRICFRETEGSDQCQRNRNTCSGWSTSLRTGNWTKVFRDDTDHRPGGCFYQWKLECK